MTHSVKAENPATGAQLRRPRTHVNWERCRELLGEAGVAAAVATTVENIVYLTGYDHWPLRTFRDHGVYAVVTLDGRVGLVAPRNAGEYLAVTELEDGLVFTHGDFLVTQSSREEFTATDLRWEAIRATMPSFASAEEALAVMLKQLGLGPANQLALDDQAIGLASREAIKSRFAVADGVDGNLLLRRVRRVKTEAEVARLREVAVRTERAMNAVFSSVELGDSEVDLWIRYQHEAVEARIVPGHCEVNIGKRASGCFPPDPEVRVQSGDTIRIDCGGRLNGFNSDTGRNAHLGPMTPRLAEAERAIHAGITAMFDLAAPGVRVVDLVRLAISTVRANGVPDYDRHHVGHGIGLDMYEFPVLSPSQASHVVLIEGEVLNFEVPFYELGTGGLQIEDTVLVTRSGIDLLTANSRSSFVIDSPAKK